MIRLTDILIGSRLHRLKGSLVIETFHPFQDGIRNDGNGVVTWHYIGLIKIHFPRRKQSVLTVKSQVGVDDIRQSVGLREREKWCRGPEGIPEGT